MGTRTEVEARVGLRTRRNRVRRTRLVVAAALIGVAALAAVLAALQARPSTQGQSSDPSVAPKSVEMTASVEETADVPSAVPAMPAADIVVAWQPSHQADTGSAGWQEYVICGDIVDRTMATMPECTHVKAWDLTHGLTGTNAYRPSPTNTPAFDAELALANSAAADVFIAIHNDGGAPSGVLGVYLPGDETGRELAEALTDVLVAETGLPDRGVIEMQLYSLESERNTAPYRCLLEIGDNTADRAYLESTEGREQVAMALAGGLRAYLAGRR